MAAHRREQLTASIDAWIEARRLHALGGNVKTVTTWIDRCAPRSATLEQLVLAGRDLLVVFYSLDDCPDDECDAYYDACERILRTGELGRPHDSRLEAYRDTLAELSGLGGDASHYRRGRADLIAHYRWRAACRRQGLSPSLSEYLEHRRVTIYLRQWIDAWELLEDCRLDATERSAPAVRTAVAAMVEWQLLQNDLVSVERDVRKGEPNIVALVQRRDGSDLVAAKRAVAQLRDASRIELDRALASLDAWAGSQVRRRRYFAIFDDCLHGTIGNYRENLVRYEHDETL